MFNFKTYLKGNGFSYLLLISGLLLFLCSRIYTVNNSDIETLQKQYDQLVTKTTTIKTTVLETTAKVDKDKKTAIKQATGFDPDLIISDQTNARQYFISAFSWSNAKEYNAVRKQYIDSLGADNSFTKTYLPPDTTIKTNEGTLSFIDFKKLSVTLDDLYLVPVAAQKDRVRYVAFVRYIMHKNNDDITKSEDRLEKSEAIIEFTAAGGTDSGGRRITEVTATSGFSGAITN